MRVGMSPLRTTSRCSVAGPLQPAVDHTGCEPEQNAMPARDRAIGFGAFPKCLCAPAWSPGESKARPG